MERFQIARDKTITNLKAADHILNVTYPLLKDPKLLMGVINNLFLAVTNTMAAILWYDRLFKNVPPFYDNFESKFNMFQAKPVPRYNIDKDAVKLIQELRDVTLFHKKSPVEFRRKEKFIIVDEGYAMKALTIEKMKEYVRRAKSFAAHMNKIVSENERIFGRSEGRIEAR